MTENLLIAIVALAVIVAGLQIALLVSTRTLRRALSDALAQLRARLDSLPAEMMAMSTSGIQKPEIGSRSISRPMNRSDC